ncbi:MAG: response regulator [Isosphaeraceae bacterium]|nr:response regulator [Isosphaeraceae bacterium]
MMLEPFDLVLVDDSISDARIIQRALDEVGIAHRLTHYLDGASALEGLVAELQTRSGRSGRPHLTLLDLNLPGLDGLQILAAIKSDPLLRVMPVVILTTSGRDEDVSRAYALGANSYLLKPEEFARYRELILALKGFWFEFAVQPARSRSAEPPIPDPSERRSGAGDQYGEAFEKRRGRE